MQSPPPAPPLCERGGEASWNQSLNKYVVMCLFSDRFQQGGNCTKLHGLLSGSGGWDKPLNNLCNYVQLLSSFTPARRHCTELHQLLSGSKKPARRHCPKLHELLSGPKTSRSLFTDSEKCPFTPLCIEDAERVGDPILFERPCKCIEDARSLVLRLDLAKCLAEEL